ETRPHWRGVQWRRPFTDPALTLRRDAARMSRASCNPLPVAALAVALAGLAPGSPVTADARAGTIQRCAATDGTTLYTDKPCAAFGATPLPMPGELAMRISSDGGSDALGRAPEIGRASCRERG